MQEILNSIGNYFAESAVNWLICGLLLIIGTILGVVTAHLVWKNLTFKKKDERTTEIKSVDKEIESARAYYKDAKTQLDLEKLGFFVGALTALLEKIPEKYGDGKFYEVLNKDTFKFKGEPILNESVKVNFDFTVYELVYFLRSFVNGLNEEVLNFLDSFVGKSAYFIGKGYAKNFIGNLPKNAKDVTIAQLIELISNLIKQKDGGNNELDAEKPQSKIQAFFGGIFDKVKGAINNALVGAGKSIGNVIVDNLAEKVIALFAEEINKLYSEQFKEQISQKSQNKNAVKESA